MKHVRPRHLFLAAAAYAVLSPGWFGDAQPLVPKANISKDLPADMRGLIEQLDSPNPWWRAGAASRLGNMGERAAPAVPYLVGMLGDNAATGSSTPGKDAAAALVKIGEPAVETVAGVFRDAGAQEDVRGRAASILGRIGDPRALEPLTRGLSDRVPGVRVAAATALGELRDARAVDPLVAALTDHPSPDAVFKALEKIGAPSVEGLIGFFGEKGAAGELRGKAASILGRLKDRRAVESLIRGLADPDAGVRAGAAAALGALGDARAVRPLAAALKDHPSSVVIDALADIGDAEGAEPIFSLAKDKDPQLRLSAVIALIRLKDPRAGELAAAEMKVRDAGVRRGILSALARANYPGAVAYLLDALEDPAPQVRSSALYDLNAFKLKVSEDSRAFAALGKALEDKDENVRDGAVEALGRHFKANPRTVDLIIPMLRDGSASVRTAAASELERIDDYRVVEPLIRATRDRSSSVWIAALQGLERITDPRAVEPLSKALRHRNREVREAAATSLGKIKDPRAVAPLVRAARKDGAASVRRAAVAALGAIRDRRAVEPLCDVLVADKDRLVRREAAAALGEIGDPRGVEPLIRSLEKDDDPMAAAAALARLRSEALVDRLVRLVRDPERKTAARYGAIRALGEMRESKALEPLIGAMAAREAQLRAGAIDALKKTGDPRAVPPIATAVHEDMDASNRARAAEALGEFKDAGAVTPLVAALNDRDENVFVRIAAAESLGKIGDGRAIEPLIRTVSDRGSRGIGLAAAAAASLGSFRDGRAVEPLIAVLREWRGESSIAARSLGEIGDPRAVSPLIEALKFPDLTLQGEAYSALKRISGQDLGRDHRAWRSWWEKNKESLLRKEKVPDLPQSPQPRRAPGPEKMP